MCDSCIFLLFSLPIADAGGGGVGGQYVGISFHLSSCSRCHLDLRNEGVLFLLLHFMWDVDRESYFRWQQEGKKGRRIAKRSLEGRKTPVRLALAALFRKVVEGGRIGDRGGEGEGPATHPSLRLRKY